MVISLGFIKGSFDDIVVNFKAYSSSSVHANWHEISILVTKKLYK